MNWNSHLLDQVEQVADISNRKEKQKVAEKISRRVRDGDVIGVGSGSTSLLAVQSIAKRVAEENMNVKVIPTSLEMNLACQHFNLSVTDLILNRPDWCFDGADEVDIGRNLNKGRGGALFKEKLVMSSCEERYILIDSSKMVKVLGTNFPIPVEINPLALSYVESGLIKLGSTEVKLRLAGGKDGPVFTENACLILDVYFKEVYRDLERDIKCITGVLESGLFQYYNPILITS
ncbi:MAG: ribose 5-phosphate isomerase A [Pedobacter sp.]|nr:ribose 5-phosphate isomerase A [Pedobacter sp.]